MSIGSAPARVQGSMHDVVKEQSEILSLPRQHRRFCEHFEQDHKALCAKSSVPPAALSAACPAGWKEKETPAQIAMDKANLFITSTSSYSERNCPAVFRETLHQSGSISSAERSGNGTGCPVVLSMGIWALESRRKAASLRTSSSARLGSRIGVKQAPWPEAPWRGASWQRAAVA